MACIGYGPGAIGLLHGNGAECSYKSGIDGPCIVLEAEHVGDAFSPSVSHDHLNAPVVICGMAEVPRFCSMVAP